MGVPCKKADCVRKLSILFGRRNPKEKPIVLLLDEIDNLVNRNQQVIYQLLDWATVPRSRLILIAISNTMDLVERVMPRVASRFGSNSIDFFPYSADQIHDIITDRLKSVPGGSKIFQPEAMRLCATRVANQSGDVRRALQICRRALEISQGKIVTVKNIHEAQSDLYSNSTLNTVSHLPYSQRLLLIALLVALRNSESAVVDSVKLWQRFDNYINKIFQMKNSIRDVTFFDFNSMISNLVSQSVMEKCPAECDDGDCDEYELFGVRLGPYIEEHEVRRVLCDSLGDENAIRLLAE
jgi:Cdc6-like AAA superfamily ATPase